MGPALRHFITTRFNTRTETADLERQGRAALHLDDAWLRQRLDLFERFCLPSVASQTAGGFTWLLFAHQDTPEPHRARILAAESVAEVVWVDTLSVDQIREHIAERGRDGGDRLLTQRLDNDDAIAPDFVARLRAAAASGPARFLNFERGYQFDATSGRLYRRREISNPFIAYVEPASEAPRTVHQGYHNKLVKMGATEQLPGRLWLQVIHGANVINEIRGVRCSASKLAGFAVNPQVVAEDGVGMRIEMVRTEADVQRKRVMSRVLRLLRSGSGR